MTGDKTIFLSLSAFEGRSVAFGNGKSGSIIGVGKVGKSLSHSIENVYLVKGLNYNFVKCFPTMR